MNARGDEAVLRHKLILINVNRTGKDPKATLYRMRNGRWAFRGLESPDDISTLYVNKRVPAALRKQGAANPIRYVGI
jgi:hypothetical protein